MAATPAKLPEVIVVGGGFGGLTLVKALKKAPVSITLVDKRNHHLFQPLLYQVPRPRFRRNAAPYPFAKY